MPELRMDPYQKQMLDDVFDAFTMLSNGAIVSLMHVEGGFTRYTPAAVDLFELPGEYISNGADDWTNHVHPEDRKRYLDVMIPLAQGKVFSYDVTYRVRVKGGDYRSFRAVGATLRNAEGKPSLIGGTMINEGVVENIDNITMLRNQYAFLSDITARQRADKNLVILYLGLNRLNVINDTYGYSYGNRVLQQTAWIIQETVGDRGEVYRMKGAKFAVLTDQITAREVSAIYDSINLKLQRGLRIGSMRHSLSVCGGMLTVTGYTMDENAVLNALQFAYRESRTRAHGNLVDYNGRMGGGQGNSLELISDIRAAVLDDCRGFSLRYQPVMSTATGQPVGLEAFIRWQDEKHGMVSPGQFLSVLEQDFIFEELADWILHKAMEDGLGFLSHDPDFMIGINISPSQLEDEYFIDSIMEASQATGFPVSNLCMEFTKGCRLLDPDHVLHVAKELKDKGIRVVIDDFGSGYDSLAFLKTLNADFVKFDLSLIRGIEENDAVQKSIRYLSELASLYAPNVCVKGVESDRMLGLLKELDISRLQGNLFYEAVDSEEIMEHYFS